MKIKIWGARGSVPAPLKPDVVTEKVVSALLGVASVTGKHRDDLLSAILEAPNSTDFSSDDEYNTHQVKRRRAVLNYLSRLSPLAATSTGGNTPCVEIRSGSDLFIIDAGSGIRELGIELMKGPWGRGEGVIHLLFSHPHWDHIQGFPFFRPAFIPGNKIYIYGVHDMEKALRRQQEFISFPISLDYMQADKIFIQIKPNEVLNFGDLRIRNICNQHPGDAYSFRFEKGSKVFVYASDSSYPDGMDMRPYLNFFADADVLAFDAQFTQRESDEKEDWGHSSSFVGLEMSQQAKVKNLLLFHYDPTYSDQDMEKILEDTLKFQQNQYPTATPVNVMIAQEGQTFDLTPPQTTQMQQVPGSKATILKPTGIFDEHVAAELRDQLGDTAEQDLPTQLIIDMADVELLQVAGLRGLVKLRKEYHSTPMALAAPSINVQQLIDLAGYLDFFAIYPSVHAALTALKARETMNLPGQVLNNRYRIESKIGEGRLGTVFKATDVQQNSPVAIKILSPSFSEAAIEQFLKQARQIVNLSHPHIVEVYDCDDDRGIAFMAEEYLESKTLQDVIDEYEGQMLPYNIALSISQGIIRALEYSHNHGIIHGDLKPKNVLLAGETVKISDFGLGRLEGGKALINIDVPLALGTARYLAPEQVLGHPIDARTDLYALGVILYELFTGKPIYEGSDQEMVEFHRTQPPPAPRAANPGLSRPLEHLILKLLDKDPTKRYASARQVRLILNSMAVPVSRDWQPRTFGTERYPGLVNRGPQMEQLNKLWQTSRQGQGQVILISGPVGIGKTRLVHEAACRFQNAVVLFGSGLKLKGLSAYYPFVTALNSYFTHTPPEIVENSLGQLWQTATRHVPEILQLLRLNSPLAMGTEPGLQHSDDLPPADSELPRLDAPSLAELIDSVTSQRPLLLVLDDLQWVDPGSLKLLAHLAGISASLPLMIITVFDNDQPLTSTLQQVIEQISSQPNSTHLTLGPILEADTRQLLENIWLQSVPNDLITAIYNRTRGNPLFIETIAHGLIEEGVVDWRDEKWHFGPVMEAGLPPRLHEAISRRIGRLSRETQSLLNQAAVLGPLFEFSDLYELSDLSEWDALESISIALERQLLKNAPGEHTMRFSHPLFQQELYNNLSALKQRLLHREAGEALERQHMAEPKDIAAWLAHHFWHAGELEKVLIFSIQAAAQANTVYAQETALYWHNRALEAIEQLGLEQVNQDQRFKLLAGRELLLAQSGARSRQQLSLSQLQKLAQSLRDPARQAVVHLRQAAFEFAVGNLTDAETEAQAALIAARQVSRSELASESLIQLAAIALRLGQFDATREHLYAAQNDVTETEHRAVEAKRLNGLGKLYHHLGDVTESIQYYRRAAEISRAVGDRYSHALHLSNLADMLRRNGQFETSLGYQRQALTIARITGNRAVEALCLRRLAKMHCICGSYEEARSLVEQARRIHRTIEDEHGQAADLSVLGTIYLENKDYVSARDHIGQALEIYQRTKIRLQEGPTWLKLGLALEGLGHLDKALHAYRQSQSVVEEIGSQATIFDARAGLARCLLAEDDAAQAQAEIESAMADLDRKNAIWYIRDPIRFYWAAYQVFKAVDELVQATAALRHGRQMLQDYARQIENTALRKSFLEKVPHNQMLLREAEKNLAPEETAR